MEFLVLPSMDFKSENLWHLKYANSFERIIEKTIMKL